MKKVVAIVQARLGSERLPQKVMKDLGGRTLISHVIERVHRIPVIHAALLAVPEDEMPAFDRVPAALYGGHPTDVLRRYYEAALSCEAEIILRITGDCPFLDPAVASYVLSQFQKLHVDIATNDTTCSGYFDGTDVEVFTREILEKAHKEAVEVTDREHVTPWMRHYGSRALVLKPGESHTKYKLSVDTQADLDFAREIVARLEPGNYAIDHTVAVAKEVMKHVRLSTAQA